MKTDKSVFSVIMILFVSTIWISPVNALSQQQTSLEVKITYPAKGQQVAVGKNLTLSGTSSYNATSNCSVFVIVDGVHVWTSHKCESKTLLTSVPFLPHDQPHLHLQFTSSIALYHIQSFL